MKINQGDVFAIKTQKGFGFIQFIQVWEHGIELVRILEPIKERAEVSQTEVDILERFSIQFLVKIAYKRKLIEKVGQFTIPKYYSIPIKVRTQHNVRGEFLGWHIVDVQTLKRELKKELSKEDLTLSPHGIFNDTLIIEYLEKNWRLEHWK
ncbi:MAG: hypothetical protein E6H07_14390 [Bacteroidetes bacterium]|nr:MAG: hypothetical protein E6H07_14390 [Bacteroidota bacterium]